MTPGASAAPRSHQRDVMICVALFAGTMLLYWRATRNWFISFDDQYYVYMNPHVQAGLTRATVVWAFTTFHAANWHPLTWLSHALDCQLFGLCPGGHHLTSILIHATNAVLLFLTLRISTGRAWPSALAAALFAWHPLRVESVAWVAERKDVLCGFFFLVALLLYSSDVASPRWWKRVVILAAFVCGLMSKPMIVTLPLVLLLWDYWPLRRREPLRRLILEKLPFFVLAAAFGVVTVIAQRAGGAVHPIGSAADIVQRIFLAMRAIAAYLVLEIWPTNLAVLYPFKDDPIAQALPATLAILAVTAAVIWNLRKFPQLFVGWAWFVVMLMPVLGILRIGEQSMADRYTYLPAIGLAIIAAWAIAQWSRRYLRTAVLVSAALLATYATASARQIERWYDTRSLFTATLAATGDNELARAEILQGRLEQAGRDCFAAPGGPAAGWTDGGSSGDFFRRLTPEQRVEYFRIVGAQIPGPAAPHIRLGNALANEADYVNAAMQFGIAVQIDPNDFAAQIGLARSLIKLRRFAEASAHSKRALELDPRNADASAMLAECQKTLSQADRRQ
jgi:tetratricopeptide (TPR) repeat protein